MRRLRKSTHKYNLDFSTLQWTLVSAIRVECEVWLECPIYKPCLIRKDSSPQAIPCSLAQGRKGPLLLSPAAAETWNWGLPWQITVQHCCSQSHFKMCSFKQSMKEYSRAKLSCCGWAQKTKEMTDSWDPPPPSASAPTNNRKSSPRPTSQVWSDQPRYSGQAGRPAHLWVLKGITMVTGSSIPSGIS